MFGIFKSGNCVTRPVFILPVYIFAAEMTGAFFMHLQFACVWQEIDKTEIWGSLNVPLWSERGTHAFAEKNNNKRRRREKTRVSLETVEFQNGLMLFYCAPFSPDDKTSVSNLAPVNFSE